MLNWGSLTRECQQAAFQAWLNGRHFIVFLASGCLGWSWAEGTSSCLPLRKRISWPRGLNACSSCLDWFQAERSSVSWAVVLTKTCKKAVSSNIKQQKVTQPTIYKSAWVKCWTLQNWRGTMVLELREEWKIFKSFSFVQAFSFTWRCCWDLWIFEVILYSSACWRIGCALILYLFFCLHAFFLLRKRHFGAHFCIALFRLILCSS